MDKKRVKSRIVTAPNACVEEYTMVIKSIHSVIT